MNYKTATIFGSEFSFFPLNKKEKTTPLPSFWFFFCYRRVSKELNGKGNQPTQSDLVSYAEPQNCLGRWRLLEIQEKTILPTEIFSIASTFQPFGSDDFPIFRIFFCHISSRDVSHLQPFVIFIPICGNDPIWAFPWRLSFLPQGTSQNSTAQVVQELNRAGHAADLACRRERGQLTTWTFKEKIPKQRWIWQKK